MITKTESTLALEALAISIATGLNANHSTATNPWKAEIPDENNWNIRINGPDRMTLYVSMGYGAANRGKVHISCGMHVGKNGAHISVRENHQEVNPPSINVTIARGIGDIVAEITRRILPEYRRLLTLALAQVESHNQYVNTKRDRLLKLAAAVHAKPAQIAQILKDDDVDRFTYYTEGKGYGTICAGSDYVNLELHSLSMEKALQILALLDITGEDRNL